MRLFFTLLFPLFLFAADFDCILVGTSPFSLFEALYQFHSGKKVLILEAASQCGGAWKSIEVCGIPRADLGCHQIGNDGQLKAFLEEYAGCRLVSLDDPTRIFDGETEQNGYYFSQGCFELIDHLLQLISHTEITLLTNQCVTSASIDPSQKTARVQTQDRTFTTSKLILTPMSVLSLGSSPQQYYPSKYYHLYLLLQDPTPPLFTYNQSLPNGISRAMNLTHFVGLEGTGQQLIVIQTYTENAMAMGPSLLDTLKERRLVDPAAYILKAEPYTYEAGTLQQTAIAQIGGEDIIEVLQTGHFQHLTNYINKWKEVIPPYKKLI